MKEIKYVGYYDILRNGKQIRNYSLAAKRKMDYICETLKLLGYRIEIISPAFITKKNSHYTAELNEEISEGVTLTLTPSCGAKNKALRVYRVLLSQIWLFLYLIRHCLKNETIIVYHNYNLALPILLAKKVKKLKIVLQIEEQYSMVWRLSRYERWKERKLLNLADDRSLVVSDTLKEKLKIKKGIVSYGSFSSYKGDIPKKNIVNEITLIFTGSIEKVRGSAFLSVNAMKFLPKKYKLIITGKIAKQDEDDFLSLIETVNTICGRKACEYKGILPDDEYQDLLLKANIALNPQQDGEFSSFLFPSKILTYLSYGLPVVSTKGESIVKSKVADLVTFADDFTPESVAKAIMNVDFSKSELSRERLDILDDEFRNQLNEVFKNN